MGTEELTEIKTKINRIDSTEKLKELEIRSELSLQSRIPNYSTSDFLILKPNRGDYWIGLSAMQMDNLRYKTTGNVFLIINNEKIKVKVENSFGELATKNDDEIIVSSSLAANFNLSVGDSLVIVREINETGKLVLKAEKGEFPDKWADPGYIGGLDWGKSIDKKVSGMVIPIDDDKKYTVGLSAMFLDNLSLNRPYKNIKVISQSKEITNVYVYNAGGMNAVGGSGIRISSKLAQDLQVSPGDMIFLDSN